MLVVMVFIGVALAGALAVRQHRLVPPSASSHLPDVLHDDARVGGSGEQPRPAVLARPRRHLATERAPVPAAGTELGRRSAVGLLRRSCRRTARSGRAMLKSRTAIGGLCVLLLAAVLFLLPLPLIVLSPGVALPVAERVRFPTTIQDPVSGELLLTTVNIGTATPAQALAAWIGPATVLPRGQVIAEDTPSEQYFAGQRELFRETGQVAAAVGLRAAGLPVQVSGRGGAQIVEVLPSAPASDRLQVGDVVTRVGGAPVRTVGDLATLVVASPAGTPVKLTVDRAGRTLQALVVPGRYPGAEQPGLGVRARARDVQIDLPYPVQVDAGQIGGPSAGLMIALTVYDLAEPQDLTRGRSVAGTGTIDLNGAVGPVGGVPLKVQAAIDAGARLFLAPPSEAAAARAVAGDRIRVVQVSTLQEAIQALQAPDRRPQ